MKDGFISANRAASRKIDSILPEVFTRGGQLTFRDEILPQLLADRIRVYDLGGGSRPYLQPEEKRDRGIHVTGIDISGEELSGAPPGSYDRTIVADLSSYRGDGDGDLVICRSTMEHIRDTEGAMRGIASTLKSGGTAAIFVPCRNAFFARLNLFLPEDVKQKLLGSLFGEKGTGHHGGFPAYYDNCTPSRLSRIADQTGLDVVQLSTFWKSDYFSVFVPAHVIWRIWTVSARRGIGDDMCETFALVLRKR